MIVVCHWTGMKDRKKILKRPELYSKDEVKFALQKFQIRIAFLSFLQILDAYDIQWHIKIKLLSF